MADNAGMVSSAQDRMQYASPTASSFLMVDVRHFRGNVLLNDGYERLGGFHV